MNTSKQDEALARLLAEASDAGLTVVGEIVSEHWRAKRVFFAPLENGVRATLKVTLDGEAKLRWWTEPLREDGSNGRHRGFGKFSPVMRMLRWL